MSDAHDSLVGSHQATTSNALCDTVGVCRWLGILSNLAVRCISILLVSFISPLVQNSFHSSCVGTKRQTISSSSTITMNSFNGSHGRAAYPADWFIVNVSGAATIPRTAERALLDVQISSSGESHQAVTEEVTSSARTLRTMLSKNSPSDDSEEAKSNAAVAHWSMTSLKTSSTSPRENQGKLIEGAAKIYDTEVSFDIRFRDFDALGPFATTLASLAHVKIRSVNWILTDATARSFHSQLRKMATVDAMQRARDFAETLGFTKVRPLELNEEMISAVGGQRNGRTRQTARIASVGTTTEDGAHPGLGDLAFQPEEVKMTTSVSCVFMAE